MHFSDQPVETVFPDTALEQLPLLSGYTHQSGSNHDPDGSSNGTTITVTKP